METATASVTDTKKKTFRTKTISPRDDDEGFVTFTAWFKVTGQVGSRQDGGDAVGTMSERSRFVRVNEDGDNNEIGGGGGGEEGKPKRGRWSYREGMPVINGVPRVLS